MYSTMDPFQTCDLLLSYIKKSNLNFSLNESPFAVSVSIKKTFVKNKNGTIRHPSLSDSVIQDTFVKKKGQIYFDENSSLKDTIAHYEADQEAFKHAIHDLDMKLQKSKVEVADLISEKILS